MTTPREHLIDWLRDAYAMEIQAEKMLANMEARLEDYPLLKIRLGQHLVETRTQAVQVESCLHQLGADTSILKTGLGAVTGLFQAWSGVLASDEVVKGTVFGAAFEYFEIINYKILIAAAEAAGETSVAAILRINLQQEEEMAAWMESNIPSVLKQFLLTNDKR